MSIDMNELERIAATYHASDSIPDIHIENLCQEYLLAWILAEISPHANVLELGYGDGLVTAALERHCKHLTVIEGAKTLAEKAARLHPRIECVHTLFEDYRPGRRFDVILASHVLEHVDDPGAVLNLLAGWLAPDAKLIVIVPNRNSLHRQLAVSMGLQPALDTLSARDHLVGHQRVYSMPGLVEAIEGSGLCVTETAGFFLKVLPNSMMLDYSRELIWALNSISPQLPKDLMANIAVIARRADSSPSRGTP